MERAVIVDLLETFRINKSEPVELGSRWVVLFGTHDGAAGRNSPISYGKLGAIGEVERLKGAASCTHYVRQFVWEHEGWDGIHDSTGVKRADSLIKLSRRGSPLPVASKAPY